MSSLTISSIGLDGASPSSVDACEVKLRPFFIMIEEVVQAALSSYQAKGGNPSALEHLRVLIQSPLKLLEESSLQTLTALNQDKKELNDKLIALHRRLIEEKVLYGEEIEQLKVANCQQLWKFQFNTNANISQLLSMLIEDRQQNLHHARQQNADLQKKLEQCSQHEKELGEQVKTLSASVELAKMTLQKNKEQVKLLEPYSEQKAGQREALSKLTEEEAQKLRQTRKRLKRKINTLKSNIHQQEAALEQSYQRCLTFHGYNLSQLSFFAQNLKKMLQERDIPSFINIVQSLAYKELEIILEKEFKNEDLELLTRVFWFHSPYLDPQTDDFTKALCISRENCSSLATMLHVTCCYVPGPQAFELLKLEEMVPPSELGDSQIEDLVDLCIKYQDQINEMKVSPFGTVKKGLQKIINFGRGQGEWHGIGLKEGDRMPEEFCKQVAAYINLIKGWKPAEIAETLIQLSEIQVDCGTGVTSLVIQKLNESLRNQLGKSIKPKTWADPAKQILETVRYQLFQELMYYLADTRGAIGTHMAIRFQATAQKANLGIRGTELANFDDPHDQKSNKFEKIRLNQLKRSFNLKYLSALVYLKIEDFLENQVFAIVQGKRNPAYHSCVEEIENVWRQEYGPSEGWNEKGYPYQSDYMTFKPEAKIVLMKRFGFLSPRPFQPKKKWDAISELSIGLNLFNIRMIKDALADVSSLEWMNPYTGDTILHWIVRQTPDIMKELLPLVNPQFKAKRNRNGHYPIHIATVHASAEGFKEVLNYYSQGGTDLGYDSYLNLRQVIERKDNQSLGCFQLMVDKICELDQGKEANKKLIRRRFDGRGHPLIMMADDNRLDCLDYLLQKIPHEDLIINDTRNRDETALYVSADRGYLDFVKRLITLGVEIDKPDDQGRTPLMIAASHGHKSIVEVLITHKADINKKSKDGKTAICYAAEAGRTVTAGFLFATGASLDHRDNNGRGALWLASQNGKLETVKKLIDLGASIDQYSHFQETPLFIAAHKGHHEVVQVLLEKGANPLLTDQAGLTPLTVAAREGHLDCLKVIMCRISKEKDYEMGQGGGTALDIAAKRGHQGCYEELEKNGYQHSFYYLSIPDREGLA